LETKQSGNESLDCVDVVLVSIALVPKFLHQNHIGVTYVKTSNFKMELLKSMPLYFVAMP
jgi:hypothetical protein